MLHRDKSRDWKRCGALTRGRDGATGAVGHLKESGTGKRRARWEATPSLSIRTRRVFLSFRFTL